MFKYTFQADSVSLIWLTYENMFCFMLKKCRLKIVVVSILN